MDWSILFKMQQNLDDYIETNHNLVNENLFKDKCLALQVELGELANETRCFKFWSTKPTSAREIITEEYVDGIHFIMSLGLEKGLQYDAQSIEQEEATLTEQFLTVFQQTNTFMERPSQENYTNLFISYLQLGAILDITEMELQEAYKKKNDKNYKRQNDGY